MAIRFQRGQITDWRIEPDIKIFTGCVGDFNAEIGGVTRDVPVAQIDLIAFFAVSEPFARFSEHFGLQAFVALQVFTGRPGLQKLNAARIGELEEKML